MQSSGSGFSNIERSGSKGANGITFEEYTDKSIDQMHEALLSASLGKISSRPNQSRSKNSSLQASTDMKRPKGQATSTFQLNKKKENILLTSASSLSQMEMIQRLQMRNDPNMKSIKTSLNTFRQQLTIQKSRSNNPKAHSISQINDRFTKALQQRKPKPEPFPRN